MSDLIHDLRNRLSPHGTVLAVSMMKDEAPYLLEWYAHHLAIGFTKILVYTNDCSDGTVEMLERLEELGLGYHRANTVPAGGKPQPSAIRHAQDEPIVQNSDWMLLFDADEFLTITHPSGTVDGLISAAREKDANGIVITWRTFGSGGVVDWSRAPVTEQYMRAAPPLWNKGWGVKTLFTFDPTSWKLGIHRPKIKNKHLQTDFPDSVRWLNGSGAPMEDYFKFRGWRSIRRTVGYDWAQVNHYAVKSIDSYAVRKLRGNVNNKKDKYNADYWALQDRNEVEDRAVLRHAPERRRIMEALLADPVLGRLHEKACQDLEERLAIYKSTDAYQELKESLIEASKIHITEVEAKPPKARDPAKIAQLMSAVERKAAAKTMTRGAEIHADTSANTPFMPTPLERGDDLEVDWVANHEIDLPADPRIFTSATLNDVISGRFDRRNARNIAFYLLGCHRLLELGTGLAFIPLRLRKRCPDLTILAHDTRADLKACAQDIAERNGLENSAKLKLTDGPLIFPGDADGQASGLAAYLQDFKPDALRLARDALQIAPYLVHIDLNTVTRVIVPFTNTADQDQKRATFAGRLAAQGFTETSERAGSGSLQFDRT